MTGVSKQLMPALHLRRHARERTETAPYECRGDHGIQMRRKRNITPTSQALGLRKCEGKE